MRHARRWFLVVVMAGATVAQAASLSLDPEPVVLGRTESVGVTFRVEEPPGGVPPPLRLAVNVGAFGPVTRQGPGVYRGVYTPPSTRFPQMAVVAVWHEGGPEARVEFLRLPLFGSTRLEVRTRPGAETRGRAGLDEFGPVKAGRNGRVLLPVVIPPDLREVEILTVQKNGATASQRLPVRAPPYNRLTAAVVPDTLVVDGRSWARVEVLHASERGDAATSGVQVVPSVGTITRLESQGGRSIFRYQPPPGTSATEVRLRVSVDDDPASATSVGLKLGPPSPATVVLRAPDRALPADGTSRAELALQVFAATGLGIRARTVEVTANGRPLEGLTEEKEDGRYRVPFVAPAFFPPGGVVRFEATVTGHAGPAVRTAVSYQLQPAPLPHAVHADVAPLPVPADGATRVRLALDVRDAAGLPLDDAKLILVASQGSVSAATRREGGGYEATYLAPSELPDGPVELTVRDASGQFEQRVPIPVRAAPRRLLIGVRAGVVHGLAERLGPRVGLDTWAPFQLGRTWLGAGVTASASRTRRTVTDAGGTLRSESEALFFPVSLRLGGELYAARRASLVVGAGATATWARFRTSLTEARSSGMGVGGLGFLTGGYALGPGQAFVELSYAFAPVRTDGFQLDAGGPGVDVGYRLGVF